MPTYSTLACNGTEKNLADWGFSLDSCTGTRSSGMKADTWEGTVATASLTDDPLFAFESVVTIRVNRASADGSPNSFSGGLIKFQGKRVLQPARASGSGQGVSYRFEGPAYDLAHTLFLQPYKGVAGNFNPGKVVLFTSTQNAGGFLYIPISVGDQIQAILQWLLDQYAAQGMAAPFQYQGRALNAGVIDLTRTGALGGGFHYNFAVPTDGSATIDPALFNFFLPSYEVKTIMCADALNKCLELSPRTNVAFDYSTVPPTVHVKSVDNFASATLPIADGVSHKSINISPRPDLQARAVVITYEIKNTVAGQTVTDYAIDKWGPHGAASASDPSTGLRVLCDTINLQGYNEAFVTGHLDCEPLAARGGTTATKRAWWSGPRGGEQTKLLDSRCRFQTLAVAQTKGVAPTATSSAIPDAKLTYTAAGVDTTGATVAAGQELTAADYAFYTNRLVRGTYHTWMRTSGGAPVKALKVRCSATMQYVMWDVPASGDTKGSLPVNETSADTAVNGHTVENHAGGHDVHVDLEITNGVTGDYSAVSSFTPGEAYLIGTGGIAQYLFNALSVLQYEGNYVKVAAGLDAGVNVTNCLNLTGGRPEWATMNAQIQSVREHYGRGETEVQLGMARHLSAGQLSSMLNMMRFRYPWYNPAIRTDNTISSTGSNVDEARTAGSANSTQGAAAPAEQTYMDYSSPGDPSTTPAAYIHLDAKTVSKQLTGFTPVAADTSAGNEPNRLQPREVAVCKPDGTLAYAIVLMGGLYTKS